MDGQMGKLDLRCSYGMSLRPKSKSRAACPIGSQGIAARPQSASDNHNSNPMSMLNTATGNLGGFVAVP